MKYLYLLLLFFCHYSQAHLSGYTDTSIEVAESGVQIVYTLPADNLLELRKKWLSDNNQTNTISTPEAPDFYLADIIGGWSLESKKRNCLLINSQTRIIESVAAYQYRLVYECPQGMEHLQIRYNLFVEQWRGHQNYTRVLMAGEEMRMRFSFDKLLLDIPTKDLLIQWKKALTPAFVNTDPNKNYKPGQNADNLQQPEVRSNWADPGFISMGMLHIWQGLDHVLFVIALLMVPVGWRRLLVYISLFTVAHSITLAATYLGLIYLSPALTEPLVALTVLLLGLENIYLLRPNSKAPNLEVRSILIFIFGLIHGVGLSYQLTEYASGTPVLGRLLFFNIGVELGQLAIIALLYWPVGKILRLKSGKTIMIMLSLLIALAGASWFFLRIL